jgi:cation transport ATPase
MDEKQYNKQVWVYGVLVVIASMCGLGTPLLRSLDVSSVLSWILGIIAAVIFLLATVTFGVFLNLKGRQWAAAILLLLLAWAGSVVYMTTRKPNPPKPKG